MKIIGQSTLADGMPYIHLGYLSATTREVRLTAGSNGFWAGGGALLLAMGAVLSLAAMRSQALRRARLLLVISGVLLVGLAATAIAVAAYPRKVYAHATFVTKSNAQWSIAEFLRDRRAKGQALPRDMTEAKSMGLNSEVGSDGWFQEMRLVRDGDAIFVVSAGADGRFGTADDIRVNVTP